MLLLCNGQADRGRYVRPGEKLCRPVAAFGTLRPYMHERGGIGGGGGGSDGRMALARGDEELVGFATAGSAGVRHAAYLLTGDRHAAEDAVQATLVRTYAAWPRVRRDDAFAYARRTLVNYVTDRWRRRLKEYPTDELPDHPAGRDFADEVALRQWVRGALSLLTPEGNA